MEISVQECVDCGAIKTFWLRSGLEAGFRCPCGSGRITRSYFSGGYEDYFVSLLRDPLTLEDLLALAQKEHMQPDPGDLRQKLSGYDLAHLTEREFYDVVQIVLTSDNRLRFREELARMKDLESLVQIIAKANPRIDIPGLQDYLKDKAFPLSEGEIIDMEQAIDARLYHPEIVQIPEW
jgi:hypothetical protein